MNYDEAVNWLYDHLPVYHRIGAAAYNKDLKNTIQLCDYFDNPQTHFPSVHVAGTNGKGSTSHMLAAILQESGYKVGLYTSPHLKSFTERIKINGKEVTEEFVTGFVNDHQDFFLSVNPSFFEITVAMAFCYFKREEVDIAIIETGLGGRLDSTNIIHPVLSVITNIGLDHQHLLGETIQEIAIEKAGIIKKNTPVVIGEFQPQTADIFHQKAKEQGSPIIFSDQVWELKGKNQMVEGNQTYQVFTYENREHQLVKIQTDQLGTYQSRNCKTALTTIRELKKLGFSKVTERSEKTGFKNISAITGLIGRWQILSLRPLIIADTGHNIDGLSYAVDQLKTYGAKQVRMVVGFVNDKKIDQVLQILPRNSVYYFTQASIPRAMSAKEIQLEAQKFGLKGEFYTSSDQALQHAKKDADPDDLIFIGGSTFVVAELI